MNNILSWNYWQTKQIEKRNKIFIAFMLFIKLNVLKTELFHKENFKLRFFFISELHQTLKTGIPSNLPKLFRKWNNRDDTHPNNFMGP